MGLGLVGYGRLGWVSDFSIGSFNFKKQIKYLSK